MPLARLKFKKSLPLPAEMTLIHKLGWHIAERPKDQDYIVFAKSLIPKKPPGILSTNPADLSDAVQTELIRKCNKVYDHYKDPELFLRSIRARINNLAMCYGGAERAFIFQWMDDNLDQVQ